MSRALDTERKFTTQMMQNRRQLLASLSGAAAAGVVGARRSLADDGPPETTKIRLRVDPNICIAPWYVAEDLLRAEGFTDIRYVPAQSGLELAEMIGHGELDFALFFAATAVFRLDSGVPITAVAGVHPGCFELFAHEPIRTVSDLKGKKSASISWAQADTCTWRRWRRTSGLTPARTSTGSPRLPPRLPCSCSWSGEVDAFLGWPPEPQELRACGIGRVIVNTAADQPWSQYLCCILCGNREFVREHPAATKRVLRATLKANDICGAEPERVARLLVNRGYARRYDYALQTLTELPYASWREFDPEDSLRFFALRLHEVGMITSSPNRIIAQGTDWRFLNELKRELKA